MAEKSLKPLGELMFRPGSAVGALARQAAIAEVRAGDLALRLRSLLDPALAQALSAAHVRDDGILVLFAQSPAWASRLRFEAPRLLDACRAFVPAARGVQVRVTGPENAAGS